MAEYVIAKYDLVEKQHPAGHFDMQQPAVFLLTEDINALAPHLPPGFEFIGILGIGSSGVVATDKNKDIFRFNHVPTGVIGFLYSNKSKAHEVDLIVSSLSTLAGRTLEAAIYIDKTDARAAVPFHCAALLTPAYYRSLRLAKSYIFELNNLRAENEVLQKDFLGVEAVLKQRSVQPLDLIFSIAKAVNGLTTPKSAQLVRQLIPVASLGLSAIDVYVVEPQQDQFPVLGFSCKLDAFETGETLASWSVRLDRLREGWVSLHLPRALTSSGQTLSLTFMPIDGTGFLPSLAISEPLPLAAFRAKLAEDSSETSTGSLAMRCWSSLPGASPPEVVFTAHPLKNHKRPSIYTINLPLSFLAQVRRCQTDWSPDFDPVSFVKDGAYIEVHPPSVGLMLARLPLLTLPGMGRIETQAFIRSDKADVVEFGVGFTELPDEVVFQMLSDNHLDVDNVSFSGWHPSSYGQTTPVVCQIPRSDSVGYVFLATRMKDQRPNSYAWACFKQIRYTSIDITDVKSSTLEIKGEKSQTRRLSRDELSGVQLNRGDPTSCRIVLPFRKAEIEGHLLGPETFIMSIKNVQAQADKVVVRVTSAPEYVGIFDFGFGILPGEGGEDVASLDLKSDLAQSEQVIFSGWNEIAPRESAIIEIDMPAETLPSFSLIFGVKCRDNPVCVVISDVWVVVRDINA